MRVIGNAIASALLAGVSLAEPIPQLAARDTPTVDLGYSVYSGTFDAVNNINAFKGIRYAAPPVGKLRWAAPQSPAKNRTATIAATSNPPFCPQTGAGAATPPAYGFVSAIGNEDCLFLNVYAPANAKNLPVFFWIHGGGHNLFSITGLDPTEIMKQNNNGFVSVIIQYRLGAFGFLGGKDVKDDGVLNAGLLDQNFALKWVQANVGKFGGDPNKVTIAGESSGGASVLYQAMAYGGKQKENLFNNVITASPWFPEQYKYDDDIIEKRYNAFASAAGCSKSKDTLSCLRTQNSTTVQLASQKVSEASAFGSFAFLPVTDGTFIKERASKQLLSGAVKGKRVLSGNMANEGVPLADPSTRSLADFRSYISTTFPLFSAADRAALEKTYAYPGDTQAVNPSAPRFSTNGVTGPTALNQSEFGTGNQQRVFNVFAEYAFDCPSYWAAGAFDQGWKYQFSAPPSYHGYDLQALWSGTPTPGASFKRAFRKIWGNFIISNSPVINVEDAKGGVANSSVPAAEGYGGGIKWPQWDEKRPVLLNLNATGGVPTAVVATEYLAYNVYSDPGVSNVISLADADKWEGGRGKRCEFWEDVAAKVPY
ncbi:alpha/beta-hydrolase [Ophiobolus disseminans]|uniref:Carboxylic ester hydrolase n=1 Tax=Ophiobolus disseminans TaxID=1469910 RepID=A0A6A6ZZ48_9PLEO|nr:alpha/beta-hydrolase [Ophiobolus disseminans]